MFEQTFIDDSYSCREGKGTLYGVRRKLREMANSLKTTLSMLLGFMSSINSYFGFMRHYNTYRLRCRVTQKIKESFLGEIVTFSPHAYQLKIDKCFFPSGQKKRKIRHQRQYRRYLRRYQQRSENYG